MPAENPTGGPAGSGGRARPRRHPGPGAPARRPPSARTPAGRTAARSAASTPWLAGRPREDATHDLGRAAATRSRSGQANLAARSSPPATGPAARGREVDALCWADRRTTRPTSTATSFDRGNQDRREHGEVSPRLVIVTSPYRTQRPRAASIRLSMASRKDGA